MPTTCGSCAAESDQPGVFTFAAVYRGYRQCRRRKRGTANAQRYEHRLLDHLVDTTRSLQDRSYAPSRSLCFVARQPKAREIHAADFRDRVVHHVLVPRLEALFEPIFIHDLYSNRVGKGTHAAVERLGGFMRAVSDNGRRPAWFLQLDVRNFFNGIDQALLFGLINHRLGKAVRQGRISCAEARDLSWLTRVILKQDFRAQTLYRCSAAELRRVPEYKRLTSAPPARACRSAISPASSSPTSISTSWTSSSSIGSSAGITCVTWMT
jgi:RNA-directed DNA polymerase